MKKYKIMVIGAGGNSSWFINYIADLRKKDQLPLSMEFTIFDEDNVEKKNLLYQDFTLEDVFENKADALAYRYDMIAKKRFVTTEGSPLLMSAF